MGGKVGQFVKIYQNSVGMSRNSDERFSVEATSCSRQKTLSSLVAV